MDLTPEELRVLGCLVEKQRTVPDTYPLSLNALRTAANQTTNRDPVVRYDEPTIEAALDRLRERGLVRRGVTAGSRVIKYWQLAEEQLGLDDADVALLAVLMLRGPQTPGELKGRTERLHRFDGIDDVVATLDRLAGRDEPLVTRLEREPGHKERRYAHLLGGDADVAHTAPAVAEQSPPTGVRDAGPGPLPVVTATELEALRADVDELRRDVGELRDRLDRLEG
jgi:uncharacterized protein YceH (UPF0502 family)